MAEITPDVDLDRPRPADALELRDLQHAQQLRLQRRRQLADLVEEQRAAVGDSPACPRLVATAPVNAPRSWPNSSRLEQRFGERRAVDRDERAAGAAAVLVERPRHELLAGPRLAGDQDGGVGAD